MSLRDRFDRYWFRPVSSVDLAACRLAVVGFQLFVLVFPHAVLMYPPYTMFEHFESTFSDAEYHPPLILQLLTLPMGFARPSVELLHLVRWSSVIVGLFALVGFKTRTFCALFAAGNLFMSAYAYSFDEHHHVEALTVMMLVLFALSPSGAALSVDSLRSRMRRTQQVMTFEPHLVGFDRAPLAFWPLLLMRWLFSLCYLSGALCKLGGTRFDWANGYTLQYYLLQDGIFWNTTSGIWLGQQHLLCLLMSWFALGVEGLFFLVLIVPALAWFFVPAAAVMHIGIFVTMRAPFFHYLPLYLAFVPISRWLSRRPRKASRLSIRYDGQCAFCLRSVTVFDALDWRGRLRFLDASRGGREPAEVKSEDASGRILGGFFALRRAARHLPLLWPVLPLLYLPGVALVGAAVYRWVATRRQRHQCSSGGCTVDID